MAQILDGKFAPLTYAIGFIERPLEVVIDAYLNWTKRNHKVVEAHPLAADFPSSLMHLEPLTGIPRRALLLATNSPWTAYFDNCTQGPDPRTPVVYLTQHLACRGLVVTCVPNTLNSEIGMEKGTYGAVAFELFASSPREFLNCERSITAANDGGKWRFCSEGSVQTFEEIAQYSARKIKDRFTPEMLQRYCEALGVRVFDEMFYRGPGLLVVVGDRLPEGAQEVTLADARQQLGIV